MKCRFCKNQLTDIFLNLGYTPLANSYLKKTEIEKLMYTPGGAFGSCRHKLKNFKEQEREYIRLIEIFKKYLKHFF